MQRLHRKIRILERRKYLRQARAAQTRCDEEVEMGKPHRQAALHRSAESACVQLWDDELVLAEFKIAPRLDVARVKPFVRQIHFARVEMSARFPFAAGELARPGSFHFGIRYGRDPEN